MTMEEILEHIDRDIEQTSKIPYSKNPLKDMDDDDEEDDIE